MVDQSFSRNAPWSRQRRLDLPTRAGALNSKRLKQGSHSVRYFSRVRFFVLHENRAVVKRRLNPRPTLSKEQFEHGALVISWVP